MVDLILLVLTFTQIPVLFVVAARITIAMNSHLASKKNPDWLFANSDFSLYQTYDKIALLISYFSALIFLMLFAQWVFINPQPSMHMVLFIGPIIFMSVGFVFYTFTFHFFVTRKIPFPEKRAALTEDRRLSAYVPMWSIYICYFSLFSIIAVYGFALFSGSIISELAVARLSGLTGMILIGTGVLVFTLRRKHSELEVITGSGGRKLEVAGCIFVLYLGVFTGIYRILGDFYGVLLFSDASFFIVMSILIQGWFIGVSMHEKIKEITNKPVANSSV